MTKRLRLPIALCAAALGACSSESPTDIMARPDVVTPTDVIPPMDASAPADAITATDAITTTDAGETVLTTAEITASTTWSGTVRLPNEFVFVRPPAVLTILPGTRIVGQPSSAVVVTRGARIVADGTRERPIVFTSVSAVTPGMTPRRGDWGGLVMLGAATINRAGGDAGAGENQIEGIDAADSRGRYGGSDDEHDCGTLRYVRIDYAGKVLARDNELNSLTLGGCGRGTVIDYLQAHRGEDDGVEVFGGTVDLRHVVISQADDDGLDWDFGWRGRVQFLVIQAPAASTESDPSGIEADNDRDANNAAPRSLPVIYNATLVGPNPASNSMPGAVLRRGTGLRMYNAIITGWGARAVDVRDAASAALATGTNPELQVSSSIFFNNGAMGTGHFIDASDNDGMFNEDMFFRDAARANRVDVDPALPPSLTPPTGSPAASGAAAPTDPFFDATATYVGAVQPGATTTWLDGWTRFE